MSKIYLDGENNILGRLGSFAAKKLLQGNEVVIINSEKVLISGSERDVVGKIKEVRGKGGASQKGPKISKLADRLLKRKIRGMLPRMKTKGREAFKRLRCEIGNSLTEEESKNLIKLEHRIPAKFVKLSRVVELLR